MKTSEFIARVERLGFSVEHCADLYSNETIIRGIGEKYKTFARVGEDGRFLVDNLYYVFEKLDIATQEALFDLVVEYARTPVEERKEEKKYYAKLPWLGEYSQYLNFDKSTGIYFTAKKCEYLTFQTKFTMREIENLGEVYNLASFEIVEVEE